MKVPNSPHPYFTPDTLMDRLQSIKIGGKICKFTREKCEEMTPLVNQINQLKRENNAVILAHSYVSPEIIYGVADFVGDSYGLSQDAMQTSADVIVFASVRFMAQTAKILNPTKTVLIPGTDSGCSLADAITDADVRELRRQYPDHTVVCYINTTAEVKAECDVCVTSSNAYQIIANLPTDRVIFLPDRLMGQNIQNDLNAHGIQKSIVLWDGTCYVHEQYDPEMIDYIRLEYPEIRVASHPECRPEIIAKSDFVGSTTALSEYVKTDSNTHYLLLTECGLADRLAMETTKTLVGTCTLCRFMKSNTLDDIFRVLTTPTSDDIVTIDSVTLSRAKRCIDAMFNYCQQEPVLRK